MKFCPNCGTPCEGANFCPGCGKDLRSANTQQSQVATPKKPVVGYAQPVSQPVSQPSTQPAGTYDIATALAPFLVRINADGKTYTITGVRDKGITEAIIPDCVTEIGEKAFYFCSNLKHVQLSKNMRSTGYFAFAGCSSLKTLIIPSNIKRIDEGSFSHCGLEDVQLPEGLQILGYSAFGDCKFEYIRLPSTLTVLDGNAFCGCSRLKSIVIHGGIKEIGAQSFNGCTNLAEVTISEGVEKIYDIAFRYCPSLKQITIPRSVTQIGGGSNYGGKVFENCPNLAIAKVPQHLVQQFQAQCDPTCTIIPY